MSMSEPTPRTDALIAELEAKTPKDCWWQDDPDSAFKLTDHARSLERESGELRIERFHARAEAHRAGFRNGSLSEIITQMRARIEALEREMSAAKSSYESRIVHERQRADGLAAELARARDETIAQCESALNALPLMRNMVGVDGCIIYMPNTTRDCAAALHALRTPEQERKA